MDIAQRLSTIQNEISNLENEKSEREQALGLLWEHPPPLDPQIVGAVMLELRNRISALEERRKLLLVEQKELLVQAANHPRPRSPGQGEPPLPALGPQGTRIERRVRRLFLED